jgi:peptide/nickel transport system substrate-binding protein
VSVGTGSGGFTGLVELQGIAAMNQPEGWGIGHAPLSIPDHDGRPIPILAEHLPSLSDGTWHVDPDGGMRVTWHLRRNVLWHDGVPFTARDVRFSWELAHEAKLPVTRRPSHTSITAIDTPDDYTAIMHWKTPNTYANVFTTSDLFIYPEHIVRPLAESGEGERILSHDFFHGGFVGLGAYRVARWNGDNSIVFEAFDRYFLGRPKIDRIVFYQFDGSGPLLTHMLTGELQMATAYGLNFVDGQLLEQHWQESGVGTVHWTPTSLQRLVLPPENPLFRDARVRRALLLAIDRDEINRQLLGGRVIVAHSLLHPNEPGYGAAEGRIAKYLFDPREALALFRAAGWQLGADGVLANEAGDRFELTFRVQANNQEQIRVQGAVGAYWKEIGVRTTYEAVPRALWSPQDTARFTGVSVAGGSTTVAALFRRWHSSFIPTAENRYLGDNLARWSHPHADRLLDRIETAFDPQEKEAMLVDLATLFTEELPCLPLYYQAEPVAIHGSLRNVRPRPNSSGQNNTTWDCHQWEFG